MARSVEVLLPKQQPVRFPDRCPVCGKATPGHTAKLDRLLGPLPPLRKSLMKQLPGELAICKQHEGRVRLARLSDLLALSGLWLASLALLIYLVGRFELFQTGWWSWTSAILAGLIVPQSLFFMVARPLFNVGQEDEYLSFTLRNRAYAEDFERANRAP